MINNFELTRDFCGSILTLCDKKDTTFIGKPNEENYWRVHYFLNALNRFVIDNSSPENENFMRQDLVAEWLELLENKPVATNYVDMMGLFLGNKADVLNDFIDLLSNLMYNEFNNGKLDDEAKNILQTPTHRFLRESMNPENSWNVRELIGMSLNVFNTGKY